MRPDDPPSDPVPDRLPTVEEKAFLARNGFLQVSGFVPDDVCAALVDHTWTRFPAHWSRNDPATWTGEVADTCYVQDLYERRGFMRFQKGDLVGNPVVDGMFGATARGGAFAQGLIGRPLSRMRVRGLYSIAPVPDTVTFEMGVRPHIEAHAAQLIALHYLEDVGPGGGGLLVWPGSHRAIYPVMESKLEHVVTQGYDAVFADWAGREPVEMSGRRGDMVIIHNRLLHAPGLNRSPNIRYGFLCDYQEAHYRDLCAQKPGPDLWEDWPAIAALPADQRDAPCDYDLPPRQDAHVTAPMRMDTQALSATSQIASDPTFVRKLDASIIARSRRDGDTWLILSDHAGTRNDIQPIPMGSDLTTAGVRVVIDGVPVESAVRYDIMARVDLPDRAVRVTVTGLDRPAWLRILRVRLPFERTAFVARAALHPGHAETVVDPVAVCER